MIVQQTFTAMNHMIVNIYSYEPYDCSTITFTAMNHMIVQQ